MATTLHHEYVDELGTLGSTLDVSELYGEKYFQTQQPHQHHPAQKEEEEDDEASSLKSLMETADHILASSPALVNAGINHHTQPTKSSSATKNPRRGSRTITPNNNHALSAPIATPFNQQQHPPPSSSLSSSHHHHHHHHRYPANATPGVSTIGHQTVTSTKTDFTKQVHTLMNYLDTLKFTPTSASGNASGHPVPSAAPNPTHATPHLTHPSGHSMPKQSPSSTLTTDHHRGVGDDHKMLDSLTLSLDEGLHLYHDLSPIKGPRTITRKPPNTAKTSADPSRCQHSRPRHSRTKTSTQTSRSALTDRTNLESSESTKIMQQNRSLQRHPTANLDIPSQVDIPVWIPPITDDDDDNDGLWTDAATARTNLTDALESRVTTLISSIGVPTRPVESPPLPAQLSPQPTSSQNPCVPNPSLQHMKQLQSTIIQLLQATRSEREATREWVHAVRKSTRDWVQQQRDVIRSEINTMMNSRNSKAPPAPKETIPKSEFKTPAKGARGKARVRLDLEAASAHHQAIERKLQDIIDHQADQIRNLQEELEAVKANKSVSINKEGIVVRKFFPDSPRPSTSLDPSEQMFVDEMMQENSPTFADSDVERSQKTREIQIFPDGRRLVRYRNGAEREFLPDTKETVITRYPNGDVKTELRRDKIVRYYYAEQQTRQVCFQEDGVQILEFANGQIEKHLPGGHKEILALAGKTKKKKDGQSLPS